MTRIFYKGAHCVFLTYDITRDETFVSLLDWLKEIKQHAAEDVRVYLVGNKSELEEQREISFDRAVDFAKTHGIHKCFETSAKTGACVEDVFTCASKELFQQLLREQEQAEKAAQATATAGSGAKTTAGAKSAAGSGTVKLQGGGGVVKKEKKKGGCC